jgi:hypothetical protein
MKPSYGAQPASTEPVTGLAGLEDYVFAEESVPKNAQLSLLAEPAVSEGLCVWEPTKFDPDLRTLKHLFERQLEDKLTDLRYATSDRRWFLFSPFELFMEHVLAKNLWRLE